MEEKEEREKEVKSISPIELSELKRLHTVLDQAPNRKVGDINLRDQALKNVTDYHIELSQKYDFNPRKVGINRHTGDLQLMPEDKKKKREKKHDDYDPLASREIGYRSCREGIEEK